MHAGRLRHKIEILTTRQVRDNRGTLTETYDLVATTWAQVRQMSTRELQRAMQNVTDSTWLFLIRWTPGLEIRETHRIRHAGRMFDVLGTARNVEERNRMVEITAREHRA